MKEFPNFAAPPSFLPEQQIFFFLPGYMSVGHILNVFHLSKKEMKEGERVARGYFHERVGETPFISCVYPKTFYRFREQVI